MENIEIKFIRCLTFSIRYKLFVNGVEHYLGCDENCGHLAVKILKEIYNIDFNIEDVFFESAFTI